MALVLIVEDDPQLRLLLAEHIRDSGYEVLEAGNADEALAVLSSGVARVDVVFSEVLMPGTIDGYGLARWVRDNRPSIRIILSTGHTDERPPNAEELSDTPLLVKPYRLDELDERLQRFTRVSA